MGNDPYRDEVSRFGQVLVIGAAFAAGLFVHALVSPHIGSIAALTVAVVSGITFEVLLMLFLRRRRARPAAGRSIEPETVSGSPTKQRSGLTEKWPCPCCGYRTLHQPSFYDLCPICFWEDDPNQSADPNSVDGANGTSLNQSRHTYSVTGTMAPEFSSEVRRPTPEEEQERTQRLG